MIARGLLLVAFVAIGAAGCRPAAVACPDGSQREGGTCMAAMGEEAGHPPPRIDSGPFSRPLPPLGECAADDADRWGDAHRTNELAHALRVCTADPCDGPGCAFSSCIARTLELSSCTGCVARELDCLLRSCPEECAAATSPSACAWCACAADCAQAFDACVERPVVACAPCHETPRGCPRPLSPALIVAAIL